PPRPASAIRITSAGAPRTFRSDASARPRSSPTSPVSSPPMRPPTSPAPRSTSTAATRRSCDVSPRAGASDQLAGPGEPFRWRLRHLGRELLQGFAGERLDVHARLGGLGEEFAVSHRGIEGAAQSPDPLFWQAGRRHEWAADGGARHNEAQYTAV